MPLEMGSRSPCTSQTSAAWLLRVALDSVSHGNSMRFRHTVPRCHTSCTVLTLLRRPGKPTQHWTNTLVRIFLGYTCGPSKEKLTKSGLTHCYCRTRLSVPRLSCGGAGSLGAFLGTPPPVHSFTTGFLTKNGTVVDTSVAVPSAFSSTRKWSTPSSRRNIFASYSSGTTELGMKRVM